MNLAPLPLSEAHQLLEPGPVGLLSTEHKARNVMTMSWHTMMEFKAPLVGCVVRRRNQGFGLLKNSRACVINIPARELAAAIAGCGNTSGRDTDKFEAFESIEQK